MRAIFARQGPPLSEPNQVAKASVDLRSLAREQTAEGLRHLMSIARHSENDTARVRAIELIWERGWGKAPTTIAGENGEGELRVTIRHIIEGRDAPRVVEHAPVSNVVRLALPKEESE